MIKLQPMSLAEFQVYLERSVAEYADDKVKAGNWPQEGALERSRQEFNKYLPQGLDTPENFLRTLIDRETALEDHARVQSIKAIALHVFGHNTAARALYEKMGYEFTNINMVKKVAQG